MKADKEATHNRHFLDARSYVTPDGREVFYGNDWLARKKELWERCGGRCEHVGDYFDIGTEKFVKLRCPMQADDPHHIIRRSVKRDDRLDNLQALCRYHHDLLDSRKTRFGEKAAAGPERCKKCGELAYCLKGLCDKCAPLAAGRP